MDTKGVDETIDMLSGWIANNPFITNTDMKSSTPLNYGTIEAIHQGRCKVGVANTYYLAFYEKLFPDERLPIRIFIPQNAHINATSYGVLTSSTNKGPAQKFLEWMSSKEAQEFDSANSNKFPTNPKAKLSGYLSRMSTLQSKESKQFDLEKATALKEDAFSLMIETGWVDEPTPVSE